MDKLSVVNNLSPIAFRYVKKIGNNLVDFHTEKINNNIGSIVRVNRELVDPRPQVMYSRGLHVATKDYVLKNRAPGCIIIKLEVNEEDIVVYPIGFNGEVARVCSYKVIDVLS